MEERVNSQDDLIGILSQRLIPSRYGSTILFDGIELYNDTEEPIEYNLFTILESLGMLKKNSDLLWIGYGAVDFKGLVIGDNISFICENFIFEYNILNIEYLLCQDLKFIHCLFSNAERIFTSTTKKRKCNISFSSCEFQSNIQINVPCKKLILSNCQYNQYIALSKKIDNLELDNVDLTKMIFDKFKADNISLKNMHTNSLSITSEKDTNEVANLVLSDKKLKTLSIKSCHFTDSLKIQNISSISLLSLEQGNIGNFISKNCIIETLKINNITGSKVSLIDSTITLFDYVDIAGRSDKTPQQKIFEFNNTPIKRVLFLGIADQSIVFSDEELTTGFYTFISSDFKQIEFMDFKNKNIQSISLFNSIVNLDFQNLKGINQIFCNASSITHNKDRILSDLTITDIILINSELKNTVFDKCEFTNFQLKNDAPKISKLNNCEFLSCTFKKKADFYKATLTDCNFSRTKFEGEADFKETKLTNCDFSFTRFMDEADFKRVKFYGKDNEFRYTQFNGRGAFWGAYFENNPVFYNLILSKDSHVYFGQLNKQKKTIKLFTFTNTIINGRLDFNEDNITTLDMKGSIVSGTLSRVLFAPKCANWETATLLKHEELKIDNLIRALEYKAEEKDLYAGMLKHQIIEKQLYDIEYYIKYCRKISKNNLNNDLEYTINDYQEYLKSEKKKLKTTYEYISFPNLSKEQVQEYNLIKLNFENFSLWLSKTANNHGQSWGQGIWFTTRVWFVCFTLFYISLLGMGDTTLYYSVFEQKLNFNNYVSLMIKYLSPTDYEMLFNYVKSTPSEIIFWCVKIFGIVMYLLGKALVPYGAFEVVQAFRKYNKID